MLSRIFHGENENAASKRKRQINTLKIFNANVTELREDAEYKVEFEAGNRRMAIMVSLPPEFPLDKPTLRVTPPVEHPWCNEHSEIVSAPGLLNFTAHSDIGRVVQVIIREFSKNPPQMVEENVAGNVASPRSDLQDRVSPSYVHQQYPQYNTYYNQQQQYPQYTTDNSVYNYNYTNTGKSLVEEATNSYGGSNCSSFSVTPSSSFTKHGGSSSPYSQQYVNANYRQNHVQSESIFFPELNKLTNEELKRLSEDEDRLDEFLDNHTQIKDLNAAVDDNISWIEKTAETNLAKECELEKLKEEVSERVKRVTLLKGNCDQLVQQYNKLSEVFTPENIKNCLKRAADVSHEESERISEDFLNRKIDVERFLATYIECRKLGQARRTKEEKLVHQLNELKRAGY